MSVKSALKIKINGQWVAVPVMIGDAEVDGVVRYDGAQDLTEEEKATARENIGAGTGGEVDISGTVRYDTSQDLTYEQKFQARQNIGADEVGMSAVDATVLSFNIQGGRYAGRGDVYQLTSPQIISVGEYAFERCGSLAFVNLPEATAIYDNAFNRCTSLTKAVFPKVKYVGENAFYGCSALSLVDLSSATGISDAFYGSALIALCIRTNTVCQTYESMYLPRSCYVYVPAALVEEYKMAEIWENYASKFRALEDYTVDGTITGELNEEIFDVAPPEDES